MRRSDTPWEAWALLAIIICIAAVPPLVGFLVVKIYRIFKPIEQVEEISLATIGLQEEDGFFKKFFIGWVICGPLFYSLYLLTE